MVAIDARLVNADFANVRGTYLVYQVGKLLYFSFLVLGTAAYVRGTKSRVVRRGVIAAAVAYALLSMSAGAAEPAHVGAAVATARLRETAAGVHPPRADCAAEKLAICDCASWTA